MLANNPSSQLPQLPLFILEETTGTLELFPSVWNAMENLTASDAEIRHQALDKLLELNAPRFSPIVTYLLVTRLTDPDFLFRKRVVLALGSILSIDEQGLPAPEEVRSNMVQYLSQIRTRQVFAMLQVADDDEMAVDQVARLLDACPYAGHHLIDILNDQKAPLGIRRMAAVMIGKVGYLDALPSLEKLQIRLEARLNGQKAMPFAPPPITNEAELVPAIQHSIHLLRAP
jgi:HEAT repeat protein